MPTELERTLASLGLDQTPITRNLLTMFNGLSRFESRCFVAAFNRLSSVRQQALLDAMEAYATQSFEADLVAIYRELLNHPDPAVRGRAVVGLWEDDNVRVLDALMRMLTHDPDVAVRAKVATALGSFVFQAECEELDESRATALRRGLETTVANENEDLEVRRHAVEALGFINDDEVRRIIADAYAHDDERMRVSALFAMGRSADECWTETVLTELGSMSPAVLWEAVRASGEIQIEQAVPPLAELLAESNVEMQKEIAWALGKIGTRAAVRVIETLLESDNEGRRKVAEDALEEAAFGGLPDGEGYEPDDDEFDDDDLDDDDDEEEDEDDSDDDEWADEHLELR
ncbi:MAG: HEAT repeat domain-containing protein [Chloroflexota bacterium]